MNKIKSVDVARLSTAHVTTLLAMGETRTSQRVATLPAACEWLHHLDEAALRLLLADLQSPIVAEGVGPLSFARLAAIGAEEASPFEGKTYLKILTSSRTSRESLETLSSYGRILEGPALPHSTRVAGTAIGALARLALHTRFGLPLEKSEATATTALLQSLAETRAALKSSRDDAPGTRR